MAYHTEWPVDKRIEALPYKIIPGEVGNFRNDVFLERAIVGERLRLAMGLPCRSAAEHAPLSDNIEAADQPETYYTPPLINVIKFACNGCTEKHQMVPDMLVANLKFLNSLSPEDYQVFKEAAALSTEVEMEEWDKSIEEAKKIATDEMGVEFIDVDVEAFKEKVLPLHESMLQENEKIRDLYDHIQAANEKAKGGQ